MKSGLNKAKKRGMAERQLTAKPQCGTLVYIAECRGALHKTGISPHLTPPTDERRPVKSQTR